MDIRYRKQGLKIIISQHTKMGSSIGLSQNAWKATRPVELNCLEYWPYDEFSRVHCQTILGLVVARRLKKALYYSWCGLTCRVK